MENESKIQTGHSIVTYRVRLYDRHFTWLKSTAELYTQVVRHFFYVLEKESSLLEQSDFLLLRALEAKCIGTKEMKAAGVSPEYPLNNFPRIPLYFRRSAINMAIGFARKKAGTVEPNMVLYKGMYQNFTDQTIELKLFTGKKWEWVKYPFTGRKFPEEARKLSPMLVLEKKNAWLEVPLSFEVEDVRTVKERMQMEESICALAFPDNDVMAVAVVLSRDGKEKNSRFFRAGKAKEEQRRKIFARIHASEQSRGMKIRNKSEQETLQEENPRENAGLYAELKNVNQYYAHSISRQILDFCCAQNIKVIVVPNYENGIDFYDKRYLKTDTYRWLGRSIIKYLKYKAFLQGIVVTSVRPYHIADRCSQCGEKIRRYNDGHAAGFDYHGGKLFLCPNGHKGNAAMNTAKNVGKNFLSYFEQEKAEK